MIDLGLCLFKKRIELLEEKERLEEEFKKQTGMSMAMWNLLNGTKEDEE